MEKALEKKYLFGSKLDFLLLGGGSILAILFIELLISNKPSNYEYAILFAFVVSYFVNNPHFSQSYMIFYNGFKDKISSPDSPKSLRYRYIAFGIFVPAIILTYFGYFFLAPDLNLLVYAVQAMFFFVGWHYVKQGYGMIILDSVLKKYFFNAFEKKIILANAYICWLASYVAISTAIPELTSLNLNQEQNMYGLDYELQILPQSNDVSRYALYLIGLSTILTSVILFEKAKKHKEGSFPWTGVMAYFTSIYLWIIGATMGLSFISFLIIPAFHSLQYSTVVSRYILNKEKADIGQDDKKKFLFLNMNKSTINYIKFYVFSVALGFIGFWSLSYMFNPEDNLPAGFHGVEIIVIMCLIFINIHHYFLDSVMWRKENNSVKKFLFQS